ncbi:Subunit of the glycosylphosphatidylinositol transamidase complex-like protein [Basidiobolus ranarum]|uniref:Subunit of the glycosylphosphatidylinositol transamidase complex-like protein n=1 Tax=Basidiobolus ranarum TaxID=34480 RepID=A0ABR2W5S7_9FUNG
MKKAKHFASRFILTVAILSQLASTSSSNSWETFTEKLLLKPLQDGKLLSNFQFTTRLGLDSFEKTPIRHYNLFPRSIGQIIQRFDVSEVHITFTQGEWDTENWGYPVASSSGTGVELWGWFHNSSNVEENWKGLTNALAGLYCASLNFIDDTITVEPKLSFRPEGQGGAENGDLKLRYGILPHENVCTENLTPWIKLLPCQMKSGLSSLLNAYKIYDADFHSMSMQVKPVCENELCEKGYLELVQTITVISNPVRTTGKRDWSLEGLFGRSVVSSCAVASESEIRVILPENEPFDIQPNPTQKTREEITNRLGRDLAIYDLKQDFGNSLDVSMTWNEPHFQYALDPPKPRLYAHRYFTGYGQEKGGIAVTITNNEIEPITVTYFDSLPWYLKLYLHTLKVVVNGKDMRDDPAIIRQMYYQPAIDRSRPSALEMNITLLPLSVTTLSLDFDRVFLKYTEHPPDANRGFNIGPAIISAEIEYGRDFLAPEGTEYLASKVNWAKQKFQIRLYTETLLVSLPTPDFSMPYNVITLTCTVIALFFGSMFNLVARQFHVLNVAEPKEKGKEKEKAKDEKLE